VARRVVSRTIAPSRADILAIAYSHTIDQPESVQAKPRVPRPRWPSRVEARRARRRSPVRLDVSSRWYREDGDDVYYTWRARLVAIPILAVLVCLMWLDNVLFDSTGVAGVVGLVLFVAIMFFAWVLVVGRVSSDDAN
jgi:hypothetical protein